MMMSWIDKLTVIPLGCSFSMNYDFSWVLVKRFHLVGVCCQAIPKIGVKKKKKKSLVCEFVVNFSIVSIMGTSWTYEFIGFPNTSGSL